MVALYKGIYTDVAADMPLQGEKRVDVAALYDPDEYRPRVLHSLGMPMFLY